MENKIKWSEEWADWPEAAGRIAELVKFGFQDEIDDIEFDNIAGLDSSDLWVHKLVDIYDMGRELATIKINKTKK